MLCQHCGQHEATRFYRTTVNGKTQELSLCPNCAAAAGLEIELSQKFPAFLDDMPAILSDMMGLRAPAGRQARQVCPSCGVNLQEISRTGKAGCATCYSHFQAVLLPYIRKMHGNAVHTGRAPAGQRAALRRRNERARLETQLQEAINTQAFERAAELRDEIRRLEKEV
ncbi:MAG: UvrB/UvrC motif-containing protein [Oscillospiraceae bacterium]|jgi:protein arginine kinase activator|nr:UvrB/UvrC motif-containing protein [Oscillospiraceae bacterium]